MKNPRIIASFIIILLVTGNTAGQVRRSALLEYDKQIDGIISRMTLEEK